MSNCGVFRIVAKRWCIVSVKILQNDFLGKNLTIESWISESYATWHVTFLLKIKLKNIRQGQDGIIKWEMAVCQIFTFCEHLLFWDIPLTVSELF